jgi:hypothetical protein
MKCTDFEKTFDLIIDGEADDLQKTRFEIHIANCASCRLDFEHRQTVRKLLKNQTEVLPSSAFDERMMREFAAYQQTKQKIQSNWLTTFVQFLSPSLRFAAWCGILIFGLGIAFLLGRMSVSQPTQTALSGSQNQTNIETPALKEVVKLVELEPKIATKTEYKTRYVEVPIIKKKIVTKVVARGELQAPTNARKKEDFSEANIKNFDNQKEIAEQFNLVNLQPVSNISYKIIKKGDTNE